MNNFTQNDMIEKYKKMLSKVADIRIKLEESGVNPLPETESAYKYLYLSLMLIGYPCKIKDTKIEMELDSKKVQIEKDIILLMTDEAFLKKFEKEEVSPVPEPELAAPVPSYVQNALMDEDEFVFDEEKTKESFEPDTPDEEMPLPEPVFENVEIIPESEAAEITEDEIVAEIVEEPVPEPEPEPEPVSQILYTRDEEEFIRPLEHFIFNEHTVTVIKNGFEEKIKIIVFPQEYAPSNMPNAPISMFAAAIKGDSIKVNASFPEDFRKILDLTINDYQFSISGYWDDGKFISRVYKSSDFGLEENIIINHYKEGIYPDTFGKVIELDNNLKAVFFPLSIENKENTGLAVTTAILSDGNTREIILPNKDGSLDFATEEGLKTYGTYWTGMGFEVEEF